MATTALEHALAAAARGLPVFPLTRGKLPAIPSPHRSDYSPCRGECGRHGHGVHDADAEPAAVRALFAAAPWATGYGVACGRAPLHLIGLDLDVKHGTDALGELERLAAAHEFTVPATVTVLTPSGGLHLWLRGPGSPHVPNSAGRLAPGIDVRGTGGYLVGPGSVTSGGVYRLAPGASALAPAPVPPALLRLLTPKPQPPLRGTRAYGSGPSDGSALLHFVRGAREGQRNARLFWAACRAYETGHGDALAGPLTAAAVSTGLPEREARGTVASAARHIGRAGADQTDRVNGPLPRAT
ncbi:bifunctional DNA primase/polymerase [Streptomyces sp. ODS28]|uniref:bifunctional DNA primase/polymerase n=1 Tax=Streptomyces sp. ODS28 TaxID=3136688 RepID=UPI0031EACCC5